LPPLPTRSPEQKHRRSEIHGTTELRLWLLLRPN
jgi:hypothetical protein